MANAILVCPPFINCFSISETDYYLNYFLPLYISLVDGLL